MTVVELLERLRAEHGIELLWFDVAGPVWSSKPPPETGPAVEALLVELEYAVRGAATGHAWGHCGDCGQAQLVPLTPELRKGERRCRMTPRCPGRLCWVELSPVVRAGWETLKLARRVATARAKPRLKLDARGQDGRRGPSGAPGSPHGG